MTSGSVPAWAARKTTGDRSPVPGGHGDGETRARVEWLMVRALLAFRVITVMVAVLSLVSEWPRLADRPQASAVVAVLVVETGWLVERTVRRRSYGGQVTAVVETLVFCLLLLASHKMQTDLDRFRVRSWLAAASVIVAGGLPLGFSNPAVLAFAVAALTASLAVVAIHADTTVAWGIQNLTAFAAAAGVVLLVVRLLRSLSDSVDEARAEAVLNAAKYEREKHRNMVHDPTGTLESLGQQVGQLVARWTSSPNLRDALTTQEHEVLQLLSHEATRARLHARRMGSFLRDTEYAPADLASVLVEAAHAFGDLGVELVTDTIEHDPSAQVVVVVRDAVWTLLVNVHRYAGPGRTTTVVYAAVDVDRWEVSVYDDGRGFDLETLPEDHGIARQVIAPVEEIGGTVKIETAPGAGTRVVMSGPVS
jgi:signal transduction histidine kinase